jgi:hypothetical protein
MSSGERIPRFQGREIGFVILVLVQFLIGFVHSFFGLGLLFVSNTNTIYDVYTIVFGLLTLFFTYGLWRQRSFGWIGTFGTLLFVAIADALTLLGLPSVPGIPVLAGVPEIAYSAIVLLYLIQPQVRAQVLKKTQKPHAFRHGRNDNKD